MGQIIIAYVNEAEHAREQIAPLRSSGPDHGEAHDGESATHWILVACPPRLPGGTGKWVTQDAIEDWRREWAESLFGELRPLFGGPTDTLTCVLATGELMQLTERLTHEYGRARVLDARQPKFGVDLAPVSADQKPKSKAWRWQIPAALAGLGALLALGAE